MKVIEEFAVPDTDKDGEFEIPMPLGSAVLTVQIRDGFLVIWAVVDPSEQLVAKEFLFIPTDADIRDDSRLKRYVGSCQESDEHATYHLFEFLS